MGAEWGLEGMKEPPTPPPAPPPPPRAPGPQAILGTGQGEGGLLGPPRFCKKDHVETVPLSLPPASPSLGPLDGCVSTDSELIKSYLSSAVDTEPSGLACSGMRVFLRVCRKWFAQTLVCAHPAPSSSSPQIHASPSPAQLTMGPGLAGSRRPGRAGAGVMRERAAGGRRGVVAVNFLAPAPRQLGARHGQVWAGAEWRGDNNLSVIFQGRVASCKPQIPLTSLGESVTTDSGRRGPQWGLYFF